jgi:flagellar biosynthetic protein FlhB
LAEGSKTEKATPKKRRDERKKGNVFMSRDAVAVVSLLGTFATLWALVSAYADQMGGFMTLCFSTVGEAARGMDSISTEIGIQGLMVMAKTVGPVVAMAVFCAVATTFAQTRFLVSLESIRPKFNRISPLQGFKRLFSLKSMVETLKGVLKITLLLVIIYMSIRDMFLESSHYLYIDLSTACAHLVQVAVKMVIRISIAFVALAALDFMYQWWDYERQMKMSKQEVKEEYKQLEGDPQVKGKIKELQRRRAQSRMMQQVPDADVVIRNPTHFAVALRYKPERDAAPIVLAKGQDAIALRIVQIAEENQVAVMENVPLARALYAQTELNQEIPPALYAAVAEVLVYIFRLNEKKQIVK